MLNGIAPVLIYSFKQNILDHFEREFKIEDRELGRGLPLIPQVVWSIPFPPIPIYLGEKLTGIYVESEQKTVDLSTQTTTKIKGEDSPDIQQSGLSSTVFINMLATRGNALIMIFSAFADLIFRRATSNEYSITYISGHNTIFNGLLSEFSIDQDIDNNLVRMRLKLIKQDLVAAPVVASIPILDPTGTLPIDGGG